MKEKSSGNPNQPRRIPDNTAAGRILELSFPVPGKDPEGKTDLKYKEEKNNRERKLFQ